MPWCKICTFLLCAQLCSHVSKIENQVVTLQCILWHILMENGPWLGLIWSLLINIYEDNASKLLLNAFYEKCSHSGKSFIQSGCLETLMISEEKLWTDIVILWNDAVGQLTIQSSIQWHHLAVRGGNCLCHFQNFGKFFYLSEQIFPHY